MRKTVARRIRKYAARNGYEGRIKVRELKRIWHATPWQHRHQIGKEME